MLIFAVYFNINQVQKELFSNYKLFYTWKDSKFFLKIGAFEYLFEIIGIKFLLIFRKNKFNSNKLKLIVRKQL